MKLSHTLLSLALVLGAAMPLAAAELELVRGNQDTIPSALSATALKRSQSLETEAVQFAWRLDGSPLTAVAAPFEAKSKEYWDRRSADELASGIAIPTTAPGAIVRLSPVQASANKALQAGALILRKDGRSYANGSGMQAVADSEELTKSAAPFSAGSTLFRIDPALGSGRFELLAPQADRDAIVHVYEPQSSVELALKADRFGYQKGQTIRIETVLADTAGPLKAREVGGLITSPGGQVRDLNFRTDKTGLWRAELPADFAAEAMPGLYEIQTFASAQGGLVLRDARTAFAYSVPSARFTGAARTQALRMRDPYVSVEFDVEVKAGSRYQISGVLYGTDAGGAQVPVAMAQRAEQLEPGVHGIVLHYGPDVLDGTKAGAPWEIRDLQLLNQGDMGLQEQRVVGVRFDNAR